VEFAAREPVVLDLLAVSTKCAPFFRVKALRGRSTEVITAGLTVVVTVREVSLGYGPTQLAPPAQSGRHQPGTLPRLPRLAGGGAGGGGGDGGGGGGGEEAARMRMIGLPIISYLGLALVTVVFTGERELAVAGPALVAALLAVVETSRVRGTAAVRTESSGRGQAPHVPGAAGGEGREHWRSSRELGGAGQGSQNRQPDDAKSRTVHPDVVSLRSVLDN